MSDSKPKEKSARELYGENPGWGAAELWEYRMKTMSPADRLQYNRDQLLFSGFSDAAAEALGAGSAERDDLARRMHAVVNKFFGD